jgi:uncharacterized protein YbaR (Trm112 family)
MSPGDFLEDLLAFLYSKGDRNKPCSGNTSCPNCGTDLHEDENGELYCPDCGE